MKKLAAILILFLTLLVISYSATSRFGWVRAEGNFTSSCSGGSGDCA